MGQYRQYLTFIKGGNTTTHIFGRVGRSTSPYVYGRVGGKHYHTGMLGWVGQHHHTCTCENRWVNITIRTIMYLIINSKYQSYCTKKVFSSMKCVPSLGPVGVWQEFVWNKLRSWSKSWFIYLGYQSCIWSFWNVGRIRVNQIFLNPWKSVCIVPYVYSTPWRNLS